MKTPTIINKRMTTFQIIIYGFLGVIAAGTLLLLLPFATQSGHSVSVLEALFTATSATCVTGLVVLDTATTWSVFGKIVILILIQIGGMGVVTIAVAAALVSGRKIGLMQRSTLAEAIAAPNVGGIVRLTGFIIRTTLVIELSGAILMAPVFCKEFGFVKGVCYAVFHSVSAFCNAGFDLMGEREAFSSMTSYTGNWLINITLILLIIIGGIGFLTWEDIKSHKFDFKKYRMQTKVVLTVSAILVIVPAIYFYFCELGDAHWKELDNGERFLGSLFQSVTMRTAGFNTLDLSAFSEAGQLIMILLMLIGGSPGSTAGGMKTTTVAVMLASALAVFRRREDANFFGRRIGSDAVKYASTIFVMYLVLFITGALVISSVENIPMLTCLFECASAIGTVGLSLGITPNLGTVSRLIIIVLMFFGRVGGLTIVFAALSGAKKNTSRLPEEKITVG